MKRIALILALLFAASAAFAQNVPTASVYSSGWNNISATNPSVPVWCPTDSSGAVAKIKIMRLWDSGVKWSQIETSGGSPTTGVYNFAKMDKVVNTLVPNVSCPMLVEYTLGSTPSFASAGALPTNNCAQPSTQFA